MLNHSSLVSFGKLGFVLSVEIGDFFSIDIFVNLLNYVRIVNFSVRNLVNYVLNVILLISGECHFVNFRRKTGFFQWLYDTEPTQCSGYKRLNGGLEDTGHWCNCCSCTLFGDNCSASVWEVSLRVFVFQLL